MQLLLSGKEYFSVEEYANAIVEYAAQNVDVPIRIYMNTTDKDGIRNVVGVFFPYAPYNSKQICSGIKHLIEMFL